MNNKKLLFSFTFVTALALATSLATSCLTPDQPGSKTRSAADVGKGPHFETEKMGRAGGNSLATPFNGVCLYSNGDNVSVHKEIWKASIGVVSHSRNADELIWIQQVSKFVLARARRDFSDIFQHEQKLTEQDLGFIENFEDLVKSFIF